MGHSTASGRASSSGSGQEAPSRERLEAAREAAIRDAERMAAEDRRNRAIDDSRWVTEGNRSTFGIPGIGGGVVTRSRGGYKASVWTPDSDLIPINGNRAYRTKGEAQTAAKTVLKNRYRR